MERRETTNPMKISLRNLTNFYRKLTDRELVVATENRKRQEMCVRKAEKDVSSAKACVESSKREVAAYEDRLRAEKNRLEKLNGRVAELEKSKKKVNSKTRLKRLFRS